MKPALPLNDMTTSDKLEVMEQLWDDLCRTPEQVPSPDWHAEVLSGRQQRVDEGKATFTDLADAEKRIRKSTR
ncbi:MAG TPA: addiction module protein [Phycisphaerae bacterium]|nr:addiction module protein [Phycisphaerae bacterium]